MNNVQSRRGRIQIRVGAIAVSIALGSVGTSCFTNRPATDRNVTDAIHSSRRMPDGKQWTTANLNVNTSESYCYEDAELNCRRYGRLYTWESAQRVCRSLGDRWRLPTDDDWRQLAEHYGGVPDDSDASRKGAYKELLIGGSSGINALLGGGRTDRGEYTRGEAHGFYWTASESSPAHAWFYNFAKGRQSLFRQREGEKERAFSVRCVKA